MSGRITDVTEVLNIPKMAREWVGRGTGPWLIDAVLAVGADVTDITVWRPAKRAFLSALIEAAQTELDRYPALEPDDIMTRLAREQADETGEDG